MVNTCQSHQRKQQFYNFQLQLK